VSKFIETVHAVELDKLKAKEEILEIYLNLAPYGGNVIGIEAAARRYFGKPAINLTLGEASLLAGVPQRPSQFHPGLHLDHALTRREFVLERMVGLGLIDDIEARRARREEIRIVRRTSRPAAPRFADFILNRCKNRGGIVRTTLDSATQDCVRAEIMRHYEDLGGPGTCGIAVVVIHVGSSELFSMIGSIDSNDPQFGWVNAAAAPRQPGSLLKPFLFAEAFERGLLTPRSVVYDVPSTWTRYQPRNMDRNFRGPMSAAESLKTSRNLPAVRLLSRLGHEPPIARFAELNLGFKNAEKRCGLTLALGTAEVKLVDITNAYAALARMGEYVPLGVLKSNAPIRSIRVFSKGASYLTLRSLGAPKPGNTGKSVWKTGTSWNYRDAWAVALTPDFVVGVWCGRYSGHGHPGLTGSKAALPLALSIMDRISNDRIPIWPQPEEVRSRMVCGVSGAPPSSHCPHHLEDEYIPGRSRETVCRLHRGKGQEIQWPKDVAPFIRTSSIVGPTSRQDSTKIVSPTPGGEYMIPPQTAVSAGMLPFQALTAGANGLIYWFLNNELLGCTKGKEILPWRMKEGHHHLCATTASGSTATLAFKVVSSDR